MHAQRESLESAADAGACAQIGLVVHPVRDIDRPLAGLRRWARVHGVDVFQIAAAGERRNVAELCAASDCDLIVAIGGDGTALAAIRAGAAAGRPVLGVACGSLGALTPVAPDRVEIALQRFSEGQWRPRTLSALAVAHGDEQALLAFNDIAIERAGEGQMIVTAELDGVLFNRFAGDGCIVSTQVGSSAYTIAAGGPLLAPGSDGFVLTPLPSHGGFRPPLVTGPESTLTLEVIPGHGGARFEADGQVIDTRKASFTIRITLRPSVATLVEFRDDEPLITGLRRRQIITDSPRILAEDARQTVGHCS